MKTFKQYLTEAGRFGYSTGTWRYYVMKGKYAVDAEGNAVTQKDAENGKEVHFHEKKHTADKHAQEIGGKVKRTRW